MTLRDLLPFADVALVVAAVVMLAVVVRQWWRSRP